MRSRKRGNVRKYHAKSFTQVSNTVLNDWTLSMRAVACFSRIQSLPDNWCFSIAGLAKTFSCDRARADGKDAIRNAVHELEEKGYLIRGRERGDDGALGLSAWALVDDLAIYDATVEDMLKDGVMLLTKKPGCIPAYQVREFSVTGCKSYDPARRDPDSEEDGPDGQMPAGDDSKPRQNRRSEPASEKPTLAANRENTNDAENRVRPPRAPAGTTSALACVNHASQQVRTSVGLANVGKPDGKQYMEENNKDHPSNNVDKGDGEDGVEASADCQGAPRHAAQNEPGHPDGRADSRNLDLRQEFAKLAETAVNRNLLVSRDDYERTFGAYSALVSAGYSPDAILAAWKARQGACEREMREPRYYPQLYRWLTSDSPDCARKSLERASRKASSDSGKGRQMRFSVMRARDPKLDELAGIAKDLEIKAVHGEASKDRAEAARRAAWDYFDERDGMTVEKGA